MTLEQKLICGRPHVRVRCDWCKEMTWTAAGTGKRNHNYVCLTCTLFKKHQGASGGVQVIRKDISSGDDES